MMRAYMAVIREEKLKKLSVTENSPSILPSVYYRISPIFPVRPNEAVIPDLAGIHRIGFFFFEHPFSRLGAITNSVSPDFQKRLWFNHGLASIILFPAEKEEIDNLKEKHGIGLRAFEEWEINNHIIDPKRYCMAQPVKIDKTEFCLNDFRQLNYDTTILFVELEHILNKAIALACQYIPSQLEVCRSIVQVANDASAELNFLYNPEKEPPAFMQDLATELRKDEVSRQKRINVLTDSIIQLNSNLSYVISQAYSGSCPILKGECLYQTYSLLGVGTAFRAISAFTNSVKRVFEKYPIDVTIKSHYKGVSGVYVFKTVGEIGLPNEEWSHERVQIDTNLKKVTEQKNKSHLVFFSGRLGFRETVNSISAAMQVLAAGDSGYWSLMTISHEMMHAHVRAILAAIFSTSDKRQISEQLMPEYYKRYRSYINEANISKNWMLDDSLRFAIFNYCFFSSAMNDINKARVQIMESKDNKDVTSDVYIPNLLEFRDIFESCYKSLNEIMAHVLDFWYFYKTRYNIYIDLLWNSWATVPAVLEHVDEYILRSLITLSTLEKGSSTSRFTRSKEMLVERLESLKKLDKGRPLVDKAIEHLKDENDNKYLLVKFIPGLYLADITIRFLHSSHIHSAIVTNDRNINPVEDGYRYAIDTGSFLDIDIKSPTIFIADRLIRALKGEKEEMPLDYRTAWTFLVCSSADS